MQKDTAKDQVEATNQNPKIEKKIKSPKNASPHRTIYLIIGLIVVAVIVSLFFSIHACQRNRMLQKTLMAKQGQLVQQIEQLKQEHNTRKEQDEQITSSFQQKQDDLQKEIASLSQKVNTESTQDASKAHDWMLLKARYYLELAQVNSYWSSDYPVSIALLEQADTLFKSSNEARILPIRQAIAKEIAELKTAQTLDITGLLSQLDAAGTSVSKLSFQPILKPYYAIGGTTSQNTDSSTWRAALKDSVSLLGKLVVVHKDDEEISPLLSPAYKSMVKERILLNLQEAQWAVLNHNPSVYKLALKQAIAQVKKAIHEQEPGVSALITQLNTLQQAKLTQEKPATGLALPLLNQYIEDKTNKQGVK